MVAKGCLRGGGGAGGGGGRKVAHTPIPKLHQSDLQVMGTHWSEGETGLPPWWWGGAQEDSCSTTQI